MIIALMISQLACSLTRADMTGPQLKAIFGTPTVVEKADNPINPPKVQLGKLLYHDKTFSLNRAISCASCHNLSTHGVDLKPVSPGHEGQLGARNSPTTLNSALNIAQFWDGRAADVEAQALGPVLNPGEMAMPSESVVVERIKENAAYAPLFAKAFAGEADPITFANFGKAIGAFERTLITRGRVDDFFDGHPSALSAREKRGLQKFVSAGCVSCHSGPNFGGRMYQKLGVVKPYPTKDAGRFDVTKNEADRGVFRVPALRNVAKTAPYFHDGSIGTLDEAVRIMAEHQLGRTLPEDDRADIVAFLGTLTAKKLPTP